MKAQERDPLDHPDKARVTPIKPGYRFIGTAKNLSGTGAVERNRQIGSSTHRAEEASRRFGGINVGLWTIRESIVFLGIFGLAISAPAAVPIPDLIFYGKVYQKASEAQIVNPPSIEITVKLNNGTEVVARVSDLVSVSDPLVQEFYVLRVPREDGALHTLPDLSVDGDVIHIFLNGEEILETSTMIVTASDRLRDVRRLDLNGLNNAEVDSDFDSLPDDWEMSYFGNLTSQTGSGDPNDDGVTNFAAYSMGVDPRQWAGGKWPTLSREEGDFVIYFRKNKNAVGLDYFVQASPDLSLSPWEVVAGTLTFVSADGDSELFKMTIPGGLEESEKSFRQFFRLLAIKP